LDTFGHLGFATLRVNSSDGTCCQILDKNTIAYPAFRVFEQIDQTLTRYTPLRYFATNIEFVATKPR